MMKQTQGSYLSQPNKDFPLDCETLDYLQTNTHVVSIIGNLAGNKAILYGCTLMGAVRSAGYVFLQTQEHPEGEVLYWEGGSIGSGLYLKQETISVQAQGYDYPRAYVRRSLAPGVGLEHYRWEDFHDARTLPELEAEIAALQAALVRIRPAPLGVVETWAGKIVPEGYALCEGQQLRQTDYPELYSALGDTFNRGYDCSGNRLTTATGYFRLPDLRGRFMVGYNPTDSDYTSYGSVGGEKTHVLGVEELPSHVHSVDDYYYIEGGSQGGISGAEAVGQDVLGSARTDSDNRYLWYKTHNTKSEGESRAHENRPPYYTLAYIMRLK